eukprot:Skav202920  [mRNA]  locus=scaffold1565:177347:179542:- [translate_table: standard]
MHSRSSQAAVPSPELTKIGARVSTKQDGRVLSATVIYFGPIKDKPGQWAGLDLDEACGKNDGSVGEERYFHCPPGHGLFVHPSALLALDEVIAPIGSATQLFWWFADRSGFIEGMRRSCDPCLYREMEPRFNVGGVDKANGTTRDAGLKVNLVEAIRFCKRPHEFTLWYRRAAGSVEDAAAICSACADNRRIVGLRASQWCCKAIEQALPTWSHLRELHLQYNEGSEDSKAAFDDKDLQSLIRALRQVPDLQVFTPPNLVAAEVSDETIQALVELRLHFPRIAMNEEWLPSLIDCRVASKAIKNKVAEQAVVWRQLELLRSYTSGNLARTTQIYRGLKNQIAQPEQDRLLFLLSLLHAKYCIIGGYEFLETLPEDFDLYKGAGASGQYIPDPVLAMSSEMQVRYILAVAHYKAQILTDLCGHVESAFASLAACKQGDQIQERLNAFVEKEGLSDVVCYRMVVETEEGSAGIPNRFRQHGFYNGMPAFCGETDGKKVYLFRDRKKFWSISRTALGSSFFSATLQDEGEDKPRLFPLIETSEAQQWRPDAAFKFRRADCEPYSLKDALQFFLQQRADDPSLGQLATSPDRLYELKMGPMKGFARAQQKQAKWLLDVNRCTFVADSPLVLATIFHLIQRKTLAMGGEISRLDNYFFKDGHLNVELKQPPCIHLNLRIPKDTGWTYEVMLTLSDFAKAKDVLHKYYEITRSQSPLDLMVPIFKACPADPTIMLTE